MGNYGGLKNDPGDAIHRLLHRAGVSKKTREQAVHEFRSHQSERNPLPDFLDDPAKNVGTKLKDAGFNVGGE